MPEAERIVYVVDDDYAVREAVSNLVRSRGWRARSFDSAQTFLEHPRPKVPSCLLLDVNMPGLDGPGLHRLLTLERDGIPIVYITGNGDIPTAVRAMKAGAVDYLTKPFDQQALIAAIELCLSQWPIHQPVHRQTAEPRILEFGSFRLDAREQCLWRCAGTARERVMLNPRTFTVLQLLVERAGRLVSEDELLRLAWPKMCVQPEVVKSQLYEIRKVLGDNPRTPRFIETLCRRGYRFIAPIREVTSQADSVTAKPSAQPEPPYPGLQNSSLLQETLEKVLQLVEPLVVSRDRPGSRSTASTSNG